MVFKVRIEQTEIDRNLHIENALIIRQYGFERVAHVEALQKHTLTALQYIRIRRSGKTI